MNYEIVKNRNYVKVLKSAMIERKLLSDPLNFGSKLYHQSKPFFRYEQVKRDLALTWKIIISFL